MLYSTHLKDTSMFQASQQIGIVLGVLLCQAALAVEPDVSTAVRVPQVERQGVAAEPVVMYRRIVDGDLAITVPEAGGDVTEGPLLTVMGPNALQHPNRSMRIGDATKRGIPLLLPDEFVGRPSMQVPLYQIGRRVWRFQVNRPIRMYAYIRFPLDQPPPDAWQIYHRSPFQPQVLYYRDFPAGENTLVLDRAQFVGVGITALDALSDREQIILSGHCPAKENPVCQVANSGDEPLAGQIFFTRYAPPNVEPLETSAVDVHVAAGAQKTIDVPIDGIQEGVVYAIHARLNAGDQSWELWLPFGRFPSPAAGQDADDPFLPFGGYWKLECCEDRELYEHALRATLYQMRQMGMNTAVLDPSQSKSPWVLDIMHEYGVKAIVRVGNKRGDLVEPPAAVIDHPAVLTLMIGDEPNLDRDWEAYLQTYETVHRRWPKFRTVTATIFDAWGTMSGSDPVRIYGEHLRRFNPILFGRWYPFRKEQFGLLHGVGYRGWLDPRNVTRAIDGSGWDVWWVGPNFFGHDDLVPYWRIPTGTELKALAHLCLAHRCTGIIGWPLHSHARPQLPDGGPAFDINYLQDTVGLDGTLGAPARHQAHKELAEIGRAMSLAAPYLTKIVPMQFQVSRTVPDVIEASAHWTTDQHILLYVVNLDHRQAHPAQVWMYCGNQEKQAEKSLRLQTEFRVAREIYADVPVQLARETTSEGIHYVRVELDDIPPGEGRLILLHGSQPDGSFSPHAFNRKMVQRLEQATELGEG